MKVRSFVVVLSAVAIFAIVARAEEKKDPLEGIKCPVSDKSVKADATVDYKGGKAFFCCANCVKAFKKDTAKFATKANHQLVATGQVKQVKCPLSGTPCKPAHKETVQGVDVYFCCGRCQGKVAKAEGDAQAELVFSDKAFKKGFELKKAEKE